MTIRYYFIALLIAINWHSQSILLCFPLYERLVITSIPKCGTFLLNSCIRKMINREPILLINDPIIDLVLNNNGQGALFLGHLPANGFNISSIQKNRCKVLFIYRDPRDQLASLAMWVKKYPEVWPKVKHLNYDELLLQVVTDLSSVYEKFISNFQIKTIIDVYNSFLPWKENPCTYTTTFEQLVGPQGGGNEKVQLNEIKNIAAHLGKTISDQEAKNIADTLFGSSETFVTGKIGNWRNYFKRAHVAAFKKIPNACKLLIDLGYEKDNSW